MCLGILADGSVKHGHRNARLTTCTLQKFIVAHLFASQYIRLPCLLNRYGLPLCGSHLLTLALDCLVYKHILCQEFWQCLGYLFIYALLIEYDILAIELCPEFL